MEDDATDARQIERVPLACVQCRGRHVKCDATQPVCGRCKRDGKECTYQKSRRGGLDRAALARRRLKLQQQAERGQSGEDKSGRQSPAGSSSSNERGADIIPRFHLTGQLTFNSNAMTFNVNMDRLLDLYYENFHLSTPVAVPLHFLNIRKSNSNHELDHVLPVLQWIGSLYAPSTPSEPYYEIAYQALSQPSLPRTPFTVQALLLLAIAQHHVDFRPESRITLDLAISIALELGMNTQEFAQQYGQGDPVLEESWRRTYFFLRFCDQHFAVVISNPYYVLRDVPVEVDLPCDDELYESGKIPPPFTWSDYEAREFADVEVVYSSITYLYDVGRIVPFVMKSFLATGTITDALISSVDTKLAIWHSLLPACKKDPLRHDGSVDEIMFLALEISTILTMGIHRPFSSLIYSLEEMSTKSFASPVPFIEPSRQGRAAHTARALKAADTQTKLLAVPCALERHHVFILCIVASMAVAQISACNTLLEDHALSIARDRVRLSLGFLNSMGSIWPLGKKMAQEVKHVARKTLCERETVEQAATDEIDLPRDDLIWPIDTSMANIDIFSGIVLPMDTWDVDMNAQSSSSSSSVLL